ncbi:beta-aspartyl-peptidase [Clostridium vincentii]|uniref:Isoaspartyl dipeptidase n=1 Tax=Clostridium vincentii TaxID=52704 RepID=A0A2T0BI68_9CLOT|nr:beta-aspartyl-peptidase [Clostridium vincentii]PRR83589.1 Isoaspartyl dipeptidase [Clostridium vincentii]
MITIIKNIEVYSPEYLGKKQVVIVNDKIEGIYDNINIPKDFIHINEVNGEGKLMFPGFIDSHVHIIGGGGEGGFSTRTPEIKFTDLTSAGITTVVGCIGTDSVCRDSRTLIAKAKALEEEGISTYCYTGSYDIPVKTLTGSIKEDLMLIDKFIGVGEVALSDHRSSQPTYEQFVNLVAEARVGGMLSNKAGIVNVHLGGGARKLDMLFSLIENTEIPGEQLLPTHINRSIQLFNMSIDYINKGGYVDLTTSSDKNFLDPGELTASKALKKFCDLKVPIEKITFSSDGNGSMPVFNEKRELVALSVCSVKTLYSEVRNAILQEGVPIEKAISVITSNVAKMLKLKDRGKIEKGYLSDFVLVDKENLNISCVYGKGAPLVVSGKTVVKGTFE